MRTTRHRGGVRTAGSAAAAAAALALIASTPSALVAEQTLTTANIINTVRFVSGVGLPPSIGDPRR